MTQEAPFGTWASPLQAADVVRGVVEFAELGVDDGNLYWVEARPEEAGRQVLVRRGADGQIEDLTPDPINVRTRCHEYGGGAIAVGHGQVVYSDFATQRLYRPAEGQPAPVTPDNPRPGSERFADGRILATYQMACVRESHPEAGEPVNELVLVDLRTGHVDTIAAGRDFYAAPRADAEEQRLAWLEWDHPNMPWDGTELMVAGLAGRDLVEPVKVAGGPEESVVQPEWGPDGNLYFISDRTDWWNLYRWDGEQVESVAPREADCAGPAWVFGQSWFGFLSGGRILTGYWQDGVHHLVVVHPDGGPVELPDDLSVHSRIITDNDNTAWFVGQGPTTPQTLFEMDVDQGSLTPIRSNRLPLDLAYVPTPRSITFPTGDGEEAYAIYYPPTNPDYHSPEGELPPLMVRTHGGPTSQVAPHLNPGYLYWTTRGFALVDLNYRGSTGYGRAYRNRLRGSWGIVDVEDVIAVVRYLAESGEIDPDRAVIRGGSAGGYTTLAALASGDTTFTAGASYYGVAECALLAEHTHKFESRYLDGLVGTDPDEVRRRSPLHSAGQITAPVILFQGLDDKVVPPEQSKMIAAALEENGVPYAYISYEGEGHGFRRAENIAHSLESELAFYGLVFGFTPHDELPEVAMVGPA